MWPHSDRNENCSSLLRFFSSTLKHQTSAPTHPQLPAPAAAGQGAPPRGLRGERFPQRDPHSGAAPNPGRRSRRGRKVTSAGAALAGPFPARGRRGPRGRGRGAGPSHGFPLRSRQPCGPAPGPRHGGDRLSNWTRNFPIAGPAGTARGKGAPRALHKPRAPLGPPEPARGPRAAPHPHQPARAGRPPPQAKFYPRTRGQELRGGNGENKNPAPLRASFLMGHCRRRRQTVSNPCGPPQPPPPCRPGRGFPRSHSPPPRPPLQPRPAARRCHGDAGTHDSHRPAVRRQGLPRSRSQAPALPRDTAPLPWQRSGPRRAGSS